MKRIVTFSAMTIVAAMAGPLSVNGDTLVLKNGERRQGIVKEGKEAELDRFKQRLEKLTLTEEAKQRIDEEMEKLAMMEPASPEFNVSRTYLDWLTILPWGVLRALPVKDYL